MTTFVGIDPGKDGAVAVLQPDGVVHVWDTPTLNVGRGSRREFDERGMVDLIDHWRLLVGQRHIRFALERVHSMPGQGVTSMFSMGEGLGLWRGILAALRVPWEYVTPQKWKGAMMNGLPKGKAQSVIVAERLFPNATLRGPRGGQMDGRADALLIAEWLRRTTTKKENEQR